jgi:hypothetical protein
MPNAKTKKNKIKSNERKIRVKPSQLINPAIMGKRMGKLPRK